MTARRNRWLIRLFPRRWRERYGDELLDLIEAEGPGAPAIVDILKTAALEWADHLFARRRHAMPAGSKSLLALSAKPSALVPMVMSLGALALVLAHLFVAGRRGEADEGATAHIFQALVVAQIPVIGYFFVRWVRANTGACLAILGLQGLALVAALLPVWYFRL